MLKTKAVVLVSGGLDSATVLAIAKDQGFMCYALSFDYGQRHCYELEAAAIVALDLEVEEHKIIQLSLDQIGGSALTDHTIGIPKTPTKGIPITYVPARNSIFLSIAMGWAEVIDARDIFIGVNAIDYSGYPDCRPEFIIAFESMANLATKAGIEGNSLTIHTPLMQLNKAEIIQQGVRFGVNFAQTVSCYNPDTTGRACGQCDACRLRREGFKSAGVSDPTLYVD